MKTGQIYITEYDMKRLRSLIEIGGTGDAKYLEELESELDRAHVVAPKEIPEDVVTMNSVVRIRDLDSGEEQTFVLVFPGKTEGKAKTISILAPIGTALIGYREGEVVEWEVPGGLKRFQVVEIMYQPERLGNFVL